MWKHTYNVHHASSSHPYPHSWTALFFLIALFTIYVCGVYLLRKKIKKGFALIEIDCKQNLSILYWKRTHIKCTYTTYAYIKKIELSCCICIWVLRMRTSTYIPGIQYVRFDFQISRKCYGFAVCVYWQTKSYTFKSNLLQTSTIQWSFVCVSPK